MRSVFPVLLILGLIVWGFLMWDRTNPRQYTEEFDDATRSERCAEFRTTASNPSDEEDSVWSLGYAGRIRQLLHGCF